MVTTHESSLSIADRVIKIIKEEGDLDGFEITLESDLRDDLGLDSVDTVHILFGLESEFNIEISEDDIETVKKVEDVVEYIWNRVKEVETQPEVGRAVAVPVS